MTQIPLPGTVVDFWRLVYDHSCTTMVLLQPGRDGQEVHIYVVTGTGNMEDKFITQNYVEGNYISNICKMQYFD